MSKTWLTIGLVSFLLAGCADSTSDNVTETDSNGPEEVQQEPSTTQVQEAAPIELEADQPAAQGEVALNPPHGQPGHDSDIAVGAPLDGSGGQGQQATQPTFNPQVVQPATQGTAPANGINPPHGQSGHDCDVAVGAPLPVK